MAFVHPPLSPIVKTHQTEKQYTNRCLNMQEFCFSLFVLINAFKEMLDFFSYCKHNEADYVEL